VDLSDGAVDRASELFEALGLEASFIAEEVASNRQVLHYRRPLASRILGGVDDLLGRWPRLAFLSYHQVLTFASKPSPSGSTS
jgi:hypothetical protein